jgi:hypothetical protein
MTGNVVEKKLLSPIVIIFMILASFSMIVFSNSDMSGVQAGSTWTQTTDRHFENGTSDNLTIVGTGDTAELKIDFSDMHHWIDQTPSTSAGNLAYHGMSTIYGTSKILAFGGATGWNSFDNDTYEYDISTNKWTNINPTHAASNRGELGLAPIYGYDKVLMFGGGLNWNTHNGDTWLYDSSDGKWSQLTLANSPSPRSGMGMASIYGYDKVLLFGGLSAWNNFFNGTYIFDFSDNTWHNITVPGVTPSNRAYMNMASIYGTDKVLLFGGMAGWNVYDDETWVYDYSDNTWTEFSPGSKPSQRMSHAIASIYNDDKVLLHGGQGSWNGNYRSDTWVFDYSDSTWTEIVPRDTTKTPSTRGKVTAAMVDGRDATILYGGMSGWSSYFSDTWKFKYFLPLKNGTYISAPFDTGSKSEYNKISWYDSPADNTSIKFQIRTAKDESSISGFPFVGPDGTQSSFYTTTSTNIWSGHTGDQWVQYIAYFNITVVKESPSLDEVTITYNCLPETIVIGPSEGSLITINKPTFSWTFSDYDSDEQLAFQIQISDNITFDEPTFDTGERTTKLQTWEFPTGTSYSEIPEGNWYWQIRTKDEDETWTEYSTPIKFTVDTIAPSSAPTFPINNGFYNSLDYMTGLGNDAEPGSGLAQIEISIKRFTDNYYWNGTTWVPLTNWLPAFGTSDWYYDTSIINWDSGVKYSIQSRAADNATNVEVPSMLNIFTIDKAGPTSNVVKPVDNTWLNSLRSISGNALDIGGSGVDKVEITISCIKDANLFDSGPKENDYWDGSAWGAKKTWLSTKGDNIWSLNSTLIKWATGDYYNVRSRAIDATGNAETYGDGITFMYDAKPPEPISIFINNGDEYTNSNTASLALSADDSGSGVAEMAFSNDGFIWSDWEEFNTSREVDMQLGDGEKTISYRVRDHTGNIADSVFDTIILDTTPPQDLSVEILEEGLYTSSRRVGLNLYATDLGCGVGDISISFDAFNWQPWEPYMNTKFINFPDNNGDGKTMVYFRARDKLGNTADPVSDSIILDTTPPFALSVSINKGALESNSTLVIMDLTGLDNTSGIDKVSFSIDGETWDNWEDFSESKSYVLQSGNGIKTVYYRAMDEAGNIADPVKTSILLNITTPGGKPTQKDSGLSLGLWAILAIVAIIIVILLVLSLAVVMRRKRPSDQELMAPGAYTIKPGGFSGPVIAVGQHPQFGAGAGAATETQVPMLAKSTATAQPTVATAVAATQPTAVPKPLPALPPARLPQTATATPQPTATPTVATPVTATPSPSPTVQPQARPAVQAGTTATPSMSQPQSQPPPVKTPTVAATPTTQTVQRPTLAEQAKANGPNVHLPDSKSTTTPNVQQPTVNQLLKKIKQ